MQRHKKEVARAAAASDGWIWAAGSLLLAGTTVMAWSLLH